MRPLAPWHLALLASLALALSGCPSGEKSSSPTTENGAATPEKKVEKKPEKKPAPPPKPALKLEELKSPFRVAKVGDWVEFQPFFATQDCVRQEIVKIDNGTVTFLLTNVTKKTKMREYSQSFEELEKDWNDPKGFEPPPRFENKVLKVGDKELKCLVVHRVGAGSKTETWYAEGIAINNGVIRSKKDDTLNMDIKAFNKAP